MHWCVLFDNGCLGPVNQGQLVVLGPGDRITVGVKADQIHIAQRANAGCAADSPVGISLRTICD